MSSSDHYAPRQINSSFIKLVRQHLLFLFLGLETTMSWEVRWVYTMDDDCSRNARRLTEESLLFVPCAALLGQR